MAYNLKGFSYIHKKVGKFHHFVLVFNEPITIVVDNFIYSID